MTKVWEIGDTCVLGRTSQTFWTVKHILNFESGGQYGLMLNRVQNGKTLKKLVATEKAIPRKKIN
jgi:hypothetical protein